MYEKWLRAYRLEELEQYSGCKAQKPLIMCYKKILKLITCVMKTLWMEDFPLPSVFWFASYSVLMIVSVFDSQKIVTTIYNILAKKKKKNIFLTNYKVLFILLCSISTDFRCYCDVYRYSINASLEIWWHIILFFIVYFIFLISFIDYLVFILASSFFWLMPWPP